MKKPIIYLLAMLCTYIKVYCQEDQLRIGDAVPTMKFDNVINHSGQPLQLPDRDSKIVILDFFATWCTACVTELPRLAALQDSMKGRVEIWLVSREPKEKLEAFFEKRTVGKAFPVIYADTVLNVLFPNRLIPHDVWIDAKGMVAAITNSEHVAKPHLESLLSGRKVALPLKRDMLGYPPDLPMSVHLRGDYGRYQFQTVFTGEIEGAGGMEGYNKEGQLIRLFYYNSPLRRLLRAGFRYKPYLPIVFSDAFDTALILKIFCYENISPASVSDTARYAAIWLQVSTALQIQYADTTIEWRVFRIEAPQKPTSVSKPESMSLEQFVQGLNDMAGCGDPLFTTDSSNARYRLKIPEGRWKGLGWLERIAWLEHQGYIIHKQTEQLRLRLIQPRS